MDTSSQPKKRRVLIASSHGLFAQGLRSLLRERQPGDVEVIGVVSDIDEAMAALDRLNPDLIIVDYDDESLNRDEFLARFVEGEKKLRVVLLSLQSDKEAIVYDRRMLAAAQIDDWLKEWNFPEERNGSTRSEFVPRRSIPNRRMEMKNWWNRAKPLVIVSILIVITTVVVDYILEHIRLLPTAASAQAGSIDSLFRGSSWSYPFSFH